MLSKPRWWNPGTRTHLIGSTCLWRISLPTRYWKRITSAIQFSTLLQQETPVVRYFVYSTMLSKPRWWIPGSRTHLIESTCLWRILLPPRFWKCRIVAIQFLALLQQITPVLRYFVYSTMLSKPRWWNAGSRMLLFECTCLRRISLPPRYWKGIIAAIQFSTLLQQETPVVRYFVYSTMLSKPRWWNPSTRTHLIERTCLWRISLPPRYWKGITAAIQVSTLLQQETPVVRYFVYSTMLSKPRWWNPGTRTHLIESTCLWRMSLTTRNCTMLSKPRWWNPGTRTHLIERTCLWRISLPPRYWKGITATIQVSTLLQQETPVVRYFVYSTMLSTPRWWNAGFRTHLIESTCLWRISLPTRYWKGITSAIQFSTLLQQETPVVRYFVYSTMLSKPWWWNPGTRTLLIESTCLKRISRPPKFWNGIIAAIRFLAVLQRITPAVRYFVNYTLFNKLRWWNPGSRRHLIESTCLRRISLPPRLWEGVVAAIQFSAL
ncbi:hypothetical protein ANTQUA_LOCUS10576 [Anthophora quadrimaculata]